MENKLKAAVKVGRQQTEIRELLIPEVPPDVLREEQLKALLATCDKGSDLESRRVAALIRCFVAHWRVASR